MRKWSQSYYSRLPKDVRQIASELRILLESEKINSDWTMRKLFAKFWPEFGHFWLATGERVEWVSFALAPHNSEMFVQFVLKEHPEMIVEVRNFLNKANESTNGE